MSKARDRHERGLRGPLAQPNKLTERAVPLRRRPGPAQLFLACLQESLARVSQTCPQVLEGLDVGIEEVPVPVIPTEYVPLAAAIEATDERPAQIVIYRRPLERRTSSPGELSQLVHRTLVEQLAVLTGRAISEIDPLLD